ncbi:uncharacterized protein [Nicotiana sylvestris]|uniref:uncharacterized protein n=1 Tax=Nicotiana sylvestris TaxID=4096 RepID=UPI00388CCB56
MTGLSTSIVAQKLPTNRMCPPVKQKLRKFKPDKSLKIKEEATKHIKAKVLMVVEYPTWLANIVLILKKDGKVRESYWDSLSVAKGSSYIRLKSNLFKLDPTKVKAILELPPPKSKKDVMSFLERLNYISRFIAQSTVICEAIFKMLRKDVKTSWTEDCHKAFDKIKEYLSTMPVQVPPEPGRPLLLYLPVIDRAFKCVLGQHDKTGRKEQDIYYLCRKFTPYEERQGTRLEDHLAENPVGGEYEPFKPYFLDEEVSFLGENITEAYDGWRMFFDRAANCKGVSIEAVLVLEMGQNYPISAKLRFPSTNNMAEYEACTLGLNIAVDMNIQELLVIGDSDLLVHQVQGEWATKNSNILPYLHHVQELKRRFTNIEFRYVPRIQNEFADVLATLLTMIQHQYKNYIDIILVRIHNQPASCAHIKEEADGKPWFHDIKEYLSKGEYPVHANHTLKHTLWRLSNHFFHNGGNLYRRTPYLGLLRCVDAKEDSKLLEVVHDRSCVHAYMIKVPPNELNATSSPWPFVAWGMDVIGPMEPTASNGHWFILVANDYFTKWAEVASYKAVTKKVVAKFVKNRIACRFGVSESIITDNFSNLNSDLVKAIWETFKIKHKNSTDYRP